MDADVGDFDRADVLIDGTQISAVGTDLGATADDVIDGTYLIAMPGFVDTHRHIWQGALRNILPNGLLSDYQRDITGTARSVFRPEDAYIGDLVSALGAVNAGVTTLLDWSNIPTPLSRASASPESVASMRLVAGHPGRTTSFPTTFADSAASISLRMINY
jgi:cytosine/adenosine deaminase-related metal-dependent hydrolase